MHQTIAISLTALVCALLIGRLIKLERTRNRFNRPTIPFQRTPREFLDELVWSASRIQHIPLQFDFSSSVPIALELALPKEARILKVVESRIGSNITMMTKHSLLVEMPLLEHLPTEARCLLLVPTSLDSEDRTAPIPEGARHIDTFSRTEFTASHTLPNPLLIHLFELEKMN